MANCILGSTLKSKWVKLPDECFDAPVFAQVEIGKKFIGLPEPGPNPHRGGGLYAERPLLLKISATQAVYIKIGKVASIDQEAPVIHVE